MPSTEPENTHHLSREASLKRTLSISKSLKGLFKSGSTTPAAASGTPSPPPPPATPSVTAPSASPEPPASNVVKERPNGLKNLTANKEKKFKSSRRDAASPSLSPTRHVASPNIGKLSLAHKGQAEVSTIHENSSIGSNGDEEDSLENLPLTKDLSSGKRHNSSVSMTESEYGKKMIVPIPFDTAAHVGDLDPLVCESIDDQLSKSFDHKDQAPRRWRSIQQHKNNSFSFRPRAMSNPPIKPHSNPKGSTPSSNSSSSSRERSNTSSIDILLHHEPDAKVFYKSEQFTVYEDGHHVHHLRVAPMIHDLEQTLNKPKNSFSLTGFFKSHRPVADETENLATALSLLPNNRCNFHKRLSQIIDDGKPEGSESDGDTDGGISSRSTATTENETDSNEESEYSHLKTPDVPKIVNEKSVIGSEELKLINQLTTKIDNSFSSNLSKTDTNDASKKQHLSDKYGKSIGVIGQGAYGVVKLCYKIINSDDRDREENTYRQDDKLFYAVKELKPRPDEPRKKFSTRLTSEFVIGLSLSGGNKSRNDTARSHPNILKVIDLMQTTSAFYEVMEFCPSGDLYSLITRSSKSGSVLHPLEADCFMKQLLHGIRYMHEHGVAHCDIKPENLLFQPNGVLKICDFGTSSVFQTAWEKKAHSQVGAAGSEPYVAPEEFIPKQQYDPRLVDCWSCGIIYCVMILGHYLWKIAIKGKDPVYDAFLEDMTKRNEYYVFEEMKHVFSDLNRYRTAALYHIFQVDPQRRITIDGLLKTAWMKRTKCCVTYEPRAM